jgi:hypothetical protein
MRKSHLNYEFLVFLGPIISSFFACSNEEKKLTKTTKGACSCPSLWSQQEEEEEVETSHQNPPVLQLKVDIQF